MQPIEFSHERWKGLTVDDSGFVWDEAARSVSEAVNIAGSGVLERQLEDRRLVQQKPDHGSLSWRTAGWGLTRRRCPPCPRRLDSGKFTSNLCLFSQPQTTTFDFVVFDEIYDLTSFLLTWLTPLKSFLLATCVNDGT